ncbi:MAG: hypothetical protein ACKESC_01960 [Candidatus Hodgkinia cicadicola]
MLKHLLRFYKGTYAKTLYAKFNAAMMLNSELERIGYRKIDECHNGMIRLS